MPHKLKPLTMRPRILICAFACNPFGRTGGEDLLGWNIALQIARFHDTWVITSSVNRQDIEDTAETFPGELPRFCYLDVPLWPKSLMHRPGLIQLYAYLWQIRILFFAWRLHRKFRFNLLHHLTYANDWMASFVGALLPIPYIRGPGGGAHKIPKAFLRDYGVADKMWERIRSAGQWIFRHDPFFIVGQHRAKALLVCNNEAMNALPADWKKKSSLFPVNGISTEDFTNLNRGDSESGSSGFRVLSAGKLIKLKGFSMAIKAFGIFASRHEDAQLEIIGDGPERANLESCVRSLGLEANVTLTKWLERDQYLGKVNSCHTFLFPSLRDGGGAVVVEAMAGGKPVVCLKLSGPDFHVTDETGLKIDAVDPVQTIHELADALEKLYESPDLRAQIGKAARKRATEVYHWDRLGDRLSKIYQLALIDENPVKDLSIPGGN